MSAEENSPVDCFCRRANEQSEAKEATASENPLLSDDRGIRTRRERISSTKNGLVFVGESVLFYYSLKHFWSDL